MTITALGSAISTTTAYFAGNNAQGQQQSLTLTNGNTIQFGSGVVGGLQTNPSATAVFANASGELIGTVVLSQLSADNGFVNGTIARINDVAALADGGFVVSYIGSGLVSPGVYNQFSQCVKVFNADGTARGEGRFVHAQVGLIGFESQVVALPGGGFTMVYSSTEGQTTLNNFITSLLGGPNVGTASTGVDIRMRTFDGNAVPTTAELLVTTGTIQFSSHTYDRRAGSQFVSDVDVMANGNVAITYMGERFSATGASALYSNVAVYNPLTLAPVFGERPYTQSGLGQDGQVFGGTLSANAYITAVLSNGLLAGVYEVIHSGVYKVLLQLVDGAGNFVNAPVDLLLGPPNATFTYRTWGMVALNDDSFVLAIARAAPGSGLDDLFLRHYSTSGALISETQVANTPNLGVDYVQGFTKGPDGSVLLSWWNSQLNGGTLVQQRYVVTGPGELVQTTDGTSNTINLGTGNDWADAGAGNDAINGFAGADRLYGDAGDDTITGGTGNDTINGGTGSDLAVYSSDAGSGGAFGVYVNLAAGVAVDGFGSVDSLNGIEVIYGTNSTYSGLPTWSDFIIGSAANETFYGFGGNDYLDLGGGNDVAAGGDGADYLFGRDGNDSLYGEAGVDYITGDNGTDLILGGAGADYLFGNAGNDTINGDAGIDLILGGAGSDVLYGGADQDYFYNVAIGDYVAGDFDAFGDLSADDYIFMPLALQGATNVIDYNGGALIYTAVAGGNWYGFVSGQSAAFTQGHIIFG
jgi:Ca2+-binding RTX toxin-like protein